MFMVKGLVSLKVVTTFSETGGADCRVNSGLGTGAAHGMDVLGVIGVGGGLRSDVGVVSAVGVATV